MKKAENTLENKAESKNLKEALLSVGAHFGFVKSRRHPSAKSFILGSKNKIEIFDLDKTSLELEKALEFIKGKGREKTPVIWVGGKSEAREAVIKAGQSLDQPYVAGRWIGGTISNFNEIKKRIARLADLLEQREKGELGKYTKKERLLFDREINKLTTYFGGLSTMKTPPKLMVVIDPKKENIATTEARRAGIPVIAVAGSDSNFHDLDYGIPANDSSRQSISFIVGKLVEAYKEGLRSAEEPAKA